MKEAFGNMLTMECDALVITTNGFVKSNGEAVMGKGIAKQVSDQFPNIKHLLGYKINTAKNIPHLLLNHNNIDVVSFPVKPSFVINNGKNIVKHAITKFNIGDKVPGFYAKADPQLIIESANLLLILAHQYKWETVLVPRFGCGAGELYWENIKPQVANILDDRFIACTY